MVFADAIVRREYCQGMENIIRRMFREIDAEACIMVNKDYNYPAEAADGMADLVLDRHADIMISDRLSSTYGAEYKCRLRNFYNNIVRSKK